MFCLNEQTDIKHFTMTTLYGQELFNEIPCQFARYSKTSEAHRVVLKPLIEPKYI